MLYSSENERKPGVLKDESPAKRIMEYVGIRSKIYAFVCNTKEVKIAKGIKKVLFLKSFVFSNIKNVSSKEDIHV